MSHPTPVLLLAGLVLVAASAPRRAALPEPMGLFDRAEAGSGLSGADGGADGGADALDPDAVLDEYCSRCHNDERLRGNMSLEGFDATAPEADAELAEKMIRKLRAGMMPPAGVRRPSEDTVAMLAAALEQRLDAHAAAHPDPGRRPFQRLTRAEYTRAVWDLLGLVVDAEAYLPPETMSGGFDNVAEAQTFSPTLLDAYLTAAGEISRLALGDAHATASESTYKVSRYASQRERVPGAPFGTRGGLSVNHTFPADGKYVFRMSFAHESTGNFFGQTAPFEEQLEISIDGERRALLDVDRWMHVQDPDGVSLKSDTVFVTAGPKRVSVTFLRKAEGPIEDLVSPHGWSLADKKIGYSYGVTGLPHLQDASIGGPYEPTGVSDNPVRARILSCRPAAPTEAEPCAAAILGSLAAQAYRRPLNARDRASLVELYRAGAEAGGFEEGVRMGLEGILASPDFVFRIEEPIGTPGPDGIFRLGGLDLASRLSFFLWGGPPDDALVSAGTHGALDTDQGVRTQVERMLADPRSEALGSRFAGQWLRLQDLDKVHPDALAFPDFHEQLAHAMREETELFFTHLVHDDRSVFELLTADYTFVNERLARHYGIPDVNGEHFRRVRYTDENRRGLLGQGSILTLTSHANRTSPVLRGKWVMEVLLGSPPPPPPPDVPDLEATEGVVSGRILTVRERMEQHRANPSCRSCHRMMDPIGLALENFDVTGAWRIRDNGTEVDVAGELYDGTPLTSPSDLRQALLRRPESLVRTFTENLMAFAIGRRLEASDMPMVRAIARGAAEQDYRLSAFILGVATSPAFVMSRVAPATTLDNPATHD